MRRPAGKVAAKAADLILTNGRFHTGNRLQPRAEAVGIRGNRIVAVGSAAGVAGLMARGTRVIDLKGLFACPGFTDCHVHLMAAGQALARLDLSGCTDRDSLIAALKSRASELPEGAWLLGRGWDQERMGGTWPRREWLDEAFGDRPALLHRVDGHFGWASTAALGQAGLLEEGAASAGGDLQRDPSGAPTGIVRESVLRRVEGAVPPPSTAERRDALQAAFAELRRRGVTSVHEMSDPAALRVCRGLREEGLLTVRISTWADVREGIPAAEELRERFPPADPMIRCDTVKFFLDGTLGGSTACLLEPYADDPASSGAAQWDEEELLHAVRRAHHAGFQLALHAIGDRAVRLALSALDGLGGGARARRHRIEHAEVVAPGDLPRFVPLGAVASMQPSQMLSDAAWLERRLGAERLRRTFPWRALAEQGTRVILGSDWPIEPLDPMRTLAAATAPQELPGRPGLSWRDGLQMTVEQALAGMTGSAAWATFEEATKGTLEAGRLADIVVLSDDPFSTGPSQIGEIEIELTVFDGRVVHVRDPEPAGEAEPPGEPEPSGEPEPPEAGPG